MPVHGTVVVARPWLLLAFSRIPASLPLWQSFAQSPQPRPTSSAGFNRVSVQASLQSAISALKAYHGNAPKHGIVVLASPDKDTIVFEPPRPVPRAMYACGPRYQLDWLYDLLNEDPVYGFIACDGSTATGYSIRSPHEIVKKFVVTSMAAGRTRRGGSSAARISRIRDDQENTFVHRVVEAAEAAWTRTNTRGVFIVGCGDITKQALPDALRHGAQKLAVLATVVAADIHSPQELWARTEEYRKTTEMQPSKALEVRITHLMETDPDMLVWGPEEIHAAEAAGVIEIVLCAIEPRVYESMACPVMYASKSSTLGMDVGILRYKHARTVLHITE